MQGSSRSLEPEEAEAPGAAGDVLRLGTTVNEDLLDRFLATEVPAYRVYEPRSLCAVLGAAGKPELDLILPHMEQDNVPWLRRRGGGGTVILGPGQVVLAAVKRVDSPYRNREYADAINRWIVEALEGFGVSGVHPEGISDLAIGEKKIVGTSIYRTRLVLFYQASLLVANDISLFTRYLAMPAKVPEYRRGRTHEEFCTTLVREGYDVRASDVVAALTRVVEKRLPELR
jgi:lipoate---protein ligase